MNYFYLTECVLITIFTICIFSYIISSYYSKQIAKICIQETRHNAKFAVIIPARYESNVIKDNLDALVKQTYAKDMFDVYVIVENRLDPTVDICAKYDNVKVFWRSNITGIGKGYALDECISNIFATNDIYDAFVILDADNVISENFLAELNTAYVNGYDVACGKRNNKNWNSSTVSACSALTFTFINTALNSSYKKTNSTVLVTGTGYYVAANVLRKFKGWPFKTMTEDYEFTNYCIINKLKTTYVETAEYYDEQPDGLYKSIIQRSRWVRGYFSVNKKYFNVKRKALKTNEQNETNILRVLGSVRLLTMVFSVILYIITVTAFLCISNRVGLPTQFFVNRLLLILLAYFIITSSAVIWLFTVDSKSMQITFFNKLKATLFMPIFLLTYIISAIRAIFMQNGWEKIEHGEKRKV